MMTVKQAVVILQVLSVVAIAGCVDSAPETEMPDHVESLPPEWGQAILLPVIINETASGEIAVIFERYDKDECHRDLGSMPAGYKLFDRNGLVESGVWHVNLKGEKHFRTVLKVEGEPPFLLAGQYDWFCIDPHATQIEGILSGFRYGIEVPRTDPTIEDWVVVEIPSGQQKASVNWRPHPLDWYLEVVAFRSSYQGRENPSGERHGIIEVYDPLGQFVRSREFHRFSSPHTENGVFTLIDGDYTVSVRLDNPALEDTRWAYTMKTFRLHAAICDYGFEWEGLCDRQSKD